jgi:hypothetical protein
MAYQPLQIKRGTAQPQGVTTLMGEKGINQRDLPQLLDPSQAQVISNYLITASGQLQKRNGLTELFNEVGTDPITMLEEGQADQIVFGYDTTVAVYDIAAGTVTDVKTDFTANTGFEGVRYGKYFFVCNGVDHVHRIDLTNLAGGATNIAASPICSVLRVIGNRLYAGNISTDETAVIYSEVDDGSDPPFTGWAQGTAATDAGQVSYRNAGAIRAIEPLGKFIVAFGDNGKYSFYIDQIDSGGTLSKVDVTQMYRRDFGGARGAIATPEGLFYVNEAGLWQMVAVGSEDIPFSDQEGLTSILLGKGYFDGVDFTNCDILHDAKRRLIAVTAAKGSSSNNYVIAYNLDHKAFTQFSGWTINRFLNINQDIYAGSSVETKAYNVFSGYDDDGLAIGTEFRQELKLGELFTRQFLKGCYVQGFLSLSTEIMVRFDIYDVTGKPISDKLRFKWTPQRGEIGFDGWGTASWGASGWGGDIDYNKLVESFDGCRPFIRNFQRVILHITSGDKLSHVLNWVSLEATMKAPIRRRKMEKLT